MPTNAFPSTVTQVDTAARFPLGYEVTVPATATGTRLNQGEQTWVYVWNDTAVTVAWAAGHVIIRDPSTLGQDWYGGELADATTHHAKVMVLGVAQHAIASGRYGFILKQGIGSVLAGGAAITADTPFTTGGDEPGSVIDYADDATATIAVIGHVGTTILADVIGPAYINCG